MITTISCFDDSTLNTASQLMCSQPSSLVLHNIKKLQFIRVQDGKSVVIPHYILEICCLLFAELSSDDFRQEPEFSILVENCIWAINSNEICSTPGNPPQLWLHQNIRWGSHHSIFIIIHSVWPFFTLPTVQFERATLIWPANSICQIQQRSCTLRIGKKNVQRFKQDALFSCLQVSSSTGRPCTQEYTAWKKVLWATLERDSTMGTRSLGTWLESTAQGWRKILPAIIEFVSNM